MPEGHTVHRTANEFNRLFAGTSVEVTSPQGRFLESSRLISGSRLIAASAVGKQMFLEFENDRWIRIHLGIYGKWNYHVDRRDEVPDPIGQVRARFANDIATADLRGPTVCELVTKDEILRVQRRLGPDPLNANPKNIEAQRFINRVRSSKAPIGLLLMNQDVIAGIGNVYRAELLFRAGISPHKAGELLTVEQVQALWEDSVKLLKVGVATGFMITRDDLFKMRPTKSERNFVYKREGLACRICQTHILIELMATRKLYWCPECQK